MNINKTLVVIGLLSAGLSLGVPLKARSASQKIEIENTWAIHQLYTTANFAPKNWLVNYYTGGLNHQIEHHIFPNISHVHYDKIAEFVKQTAKECNLPYHEFKTTREAILSHFTHLKNLGMKPELSA